MEKSVRSIQKENQEIFDLKKEYSKSFAKYPQLVKYIDQLLTYTPIYESNINILNQPTKGATISKNLDKEKLCEHVYPLCINLKIYAKENHLSQMHVDTKWSRSSIEKMTVDKLILLSDICIEAATSLAEKWSEIGITQNDFDALVAAKNQLEISKKKPEEINKKKKIANTVLEETKKKNKVLIHQYIVPLMKAAFKSKNGEIWKKFSDIIDSNIVRSHKLAVRGQLIDEDTEAPILYAKMELKGEFACKRLRSKTGNFEVRKLLPGDYTLEFTHEAYHPVSYSFTNRWGITNELLIKMKMTKIVKQENEREKNKEAVE